MSNHHSSRRSRRELAAGIGCLAAAAGFGALAVRMQAWATAVGAKAWADGLAAHDPATLAGECARWAACGAFILLACAGLWSFAAWAGWVRGWAGPARLAGLVPDAGPRPRWFWPALAVVLAVALVLRVPRMTLSFYNDEAHNYVRLIGGEWKNFGEPNAKFRVPPWTDTAFRNSSGNNGFFFSLMALTCLEGWRRATGAGIDVAREWPVRLPALVAGVATVAVLALALRRCGRPGAGLAAALLLALHPWHVRYSSEGRGYAVMIACLALGFLFAARALRTGNWRDWVGHGLSQYGALWAYPGALFAVASGQAAVGGYLVFRWLKARNLTDARDRAAGGHLVRWAGGGLVAVMAAAFLLAPGVIGLRAQLASNPSLVRAPGEAIPAGWWADTLSFLGVGCGWDGSTPGNPVNPVADGHPLRMLAVLAMGVALVPGAGRAFRDPALRLVGAVAVLQVASLAVLYAYADFSRNVLLPWYGLPALPGLVLLAGLAASGGRGRRAGGWGALPVGCVGVGMATVLPVIVTHGKADPRGLVRVARGGDFPDQDAAPVTLALWSDAPVYDPRMRGIEDEASLRRAMDAARRDQRPLFVFTAHEERALRSHPGIMRLLRESGEFRGVDVKWALESSGHTNYLYRMEDGQPAKSLTPP